MVLLYFFSKDAAQIGNVPQRPDDDIVETIYKAMAFVFERRVIDPAIGNGALKTISRTEFLRKLVEMVGKIGIQAHSISAEEEIKRQYCQVARRVNQNRIDQENPVGRCGGGGTFRSCDR